MVLETLWDKLLELWAWVLEVQVKEGLGHMLEDNRLTDHLEVSC